MPKKEKYKLVNYHGRLEERHLESTNEKDAALEALDRLGYGICSKGLKVKTWVRLTRKIATKKKKQGR